MPYVNERWLGGMLTNFQTVSTRVKRMKEFEAMEKAGDFEAMPKKEALRHTRELEKLQRNLGGIRDWEASRRHLRHRHQQGAHRSHRGQQIGPTDRGGGGHQCDPDVISYVIPGNDDAIRSGALLCRVIADAVVEGRFIAEQRPAPKPPVPPASPQAAAAPPAPAAAEAPAPVEAPAPPPDAAKAKAPTEAPPPPPPPPAPAPDPTRPRPRPKA